VAVDALTRSSLDNRDGLFERLDRLMPLRRRVLVRANSNHGIQVQLHNTRITDLPGASEVGGRAATSEISPTEVDVTAGCLPVRRYDVR
jgi:hypothetical protein